MTCKTHLRFLWAFSRLPSASLDTLLPLFLCLPSTAPTRDTSGSRLRQEVVDKCVMRVSGDVIGRSPADRYSLFSPSLSLTLTKSSVCNPRRISCSASPPPSSRRSCACTKRSRRYTKVSGRLARREREIKVREGGAKMREASVRVEYVRGEREERNLRGNILG